MTALRFTLKRTTTWILLALAVAGLGGLGAYLVRPASTDRVLLLSAPLDKLGKDAGPGLGILLSDLLEVMAGATVTKAGALPSPEELERLPPQANVFRYQGRREGEQLALTLEWNTVARLLSGKPWTRRVIPALAPAKAMADAVEHWPLPVRYHHLHDLIPRTAPAFWALLEGLAIQDDHEAAEHLPASQRLAEEEPDCATAWAVLGDHLYRSIWVHPELTGIGLSSRTHHAFQRAVERVPGYPRATFLWSLMLTDTGNQALALRQLQAARRLRPHCPDLYLGLAYAGRTSGLLEGARRSLARRQELLGPRAIPTEWFVETTHLYLGDLEAFKQNLARAQSPQPDASILFYQGYAALLQGRNGEAAQWMRQGGHPGMNPVPFRDLCQVYGAYLEGRPREGLAKLHEIDEVRGKLRIPDGEWTFKEAEAYALLGDGAQGVDAATRAFVQGFSCAHWYETSPFLAKVREHPRWPMLRRNIRERQAELEGSFPPSTFTP